MTPTLPSWVRKRDGRREPFDADKISQSLYAATEAAGSPNAFLARELTDGVLHFLAHEAGAEPTTAEIAELVEKVVRELGQPTLAQRFREDRVVKHQPLAPPTPRRVGQCQFAFSPGDPPDTVVRGCLRAYSLQAIFARDIAAAHAGGLLRLSGLETPDVLEALVMDPSAPSTQAPWAMAWTLARDARRLAANLVLDGMELQAARQGAGWLDGLAAALPAHGCSAQLHLGPATPPAWASQSAPGPLFGDFVNQETIREIAPARLFACPGLLDACSVVWHLQSRDFDDPSRRRELTDVLARTEVLHRVSFAFDRSRAGLCLGPGLDRDHPALLLRVGLMLRNFLHLPEVHGDADRLLAKLASLMRMAASAGAQKRNHLRRRRPDLSRGFLLDRARLVVEVCEVAAVVRELCGAGPAQSPIALNAACRILRTAREAAAAASRATGLDIVVADHADLHLDEPGPRDADGTAQQSAAAKLLEDARDGTVVVHGPSGNLTPDLCLAQIAWARRAAGVARIQFLSSAMTPPA